MKLKVPVSHLLNKNTFFRGPRLDEKKGFDTCRGDPYENEVDFGSYVPGFPVYTFTFEINLCLGTNPKSICLFYSKFLGFGFGCVNINNGNLLMT